MKDIHDHFKNPTPRKIAQPRQTAAPRNPITIPRILVGKERYEPQNIGKLHITLDTNVVIDAIVATKKGEKANDKEKASKKIIDLLAEHKFLVCMNSWLKEEYEAITTRLIKKGEILEPDSAYALKIIIENSFFVRTSVVGIHTSGSFHDDHLFDGTIADYLITSDKGDVNTTKVVSRQKNFKKIVSPEEFIEEISRI